MSFTYAEFTTRNMGFVTEEQQDSLRNGRLFIAGVGGMGGAAFATLVRAGVGHIGIADIDDFEVSNLNRQVAATLDTVDVSKVTASADMARRINPEIELATYGGEWTDKLDEITRDYSVIINGTDDTRATVALLRAAKSTGATVIDAYAASLPSVYVIRPDAPRPEERMGYPTVGCAPKDITEEMVQTCVQKELEYVLTHSSSRKYVDLDIAAEFAAGKRSRFSFAPMVITTGNIMAYEALALMLDQKTKTDDRGYFFNPHTARTELPLAWPFSALKMLLVRKFLNSMLSA